MNRWVAEPVQDIMSQSHTYVVNKASLHSVYNDDMRGIIPAKKSKSLTI